MLGTAGVLGGLFVGCGMETQLVRAFPSPAVAKSLLTVGGYVAITAAHGYSLSYTGNARKMFNVPHPTESTEVPYLNASRGYYNLLEHFPFFLFNYLLARESAPCVAGLAAMMFGLGRVVYTKGYATEGPKGRVAGFMIATFASMSCLGVGIFNLLLLGAP
jgi:MAPEG family